MIHHAKLSRWLQPGGHVNAGDADLLATAVREAEEETGLSGLPSTEARVLDLDVHHGNGTSQLFDDRDERPGIKFKDADLVGIPLRVTFGEKNYEAGYAEIRDRKKGETVRVGISAIADRVCAELDLKRKECAP